MTAIYKRELRAYFYFFIGCLFIGATLFLLGIYFAVYNLFLGYSYIGYALSGVTFLFLISIPILTMRILAEERKQKTDQLILTAPISVTQIVAGKFLALSTIFAIPIVIISFYPLILSAFGSVSFSEAYVAVLGFFLYGLACIAIGIFVSSLTESQVIAAVVTFAILFIGYVMSALCSMISTTGNLLTKILGAFDMVSRFEQLLNGSLYLSSIVYYLSVIVLFLIFTVQVIQKRRYQASLKNAGMSAYASAVVVVSSVIMVFVNLLVSELPEKFTVFDVTSQKLYSLTEETKELVEGLSEEIQLYVIVNEDMADTMLDTTLKKYEGLSEQLTVTYVDPAVNPKFFTQYTDSAITSNSIIVESNRRSRIIDYNDIYQTEIDYNTYTQNVTGYDAEGQLTSALAYVTAEDMPKAYLIEGHGESVLESSFMGMIEKANIVCETINLMDYDEVPEDAQFLLINAPEEDLSSDDTEKVLHYMENGGNVILISCYTGKELPNFEKLLAYYQVSVTKGMIVETDPDHYYQNPFYLLPELGYDDITQNVYGNGGYIFAPYAQGLSYTESDDVSVTPLLWASDSCYVREELEQRTTYEMQDDDEPGPFDIAYKCVKTLDEGETTGIIISSAYLFSDSADSMVAGNNLKLFGGILGQMASYTSSISIPAKSYELSYLTLSQSALMLLSLLTVIVIPFAFLIMGFVVWIKRRKK